ncbi:ketopantoate hydroxymethyltransferase [Paenibacillus sp. GCM10012307]|uniref:Ketopantoate hydroxymethyltransferase n=1 Tax=Paenibacillus roseus TaxID=2798579 RepID=A0A934IX33_9BACL|nr:ketopantoate hydroxymethyltransferase [Paenibacillus roseus]MBJ6360886.1 ketopantoate hydroxymethyltransferase [Paenibacillus roseus]
MINPSLLHDMAVILNARIAKVVLNGSYEITDFRVKQVTDSTVALNYFVPVSDVSLITRIELQDAAGIVLTSNDVHVPLAADQIMMQTVAVKEAI